MVYAQASQNDCVCSLIFLYFLIHPVLHVEEREGGVYCQKLEGNTAM